MDLPEVIQTCSTQDSKGSFSFDLSTIPLTRYDDLSEAFRTWGIESIISLDLNCREHHEFLDDCPSSADAVDLPVSITQSIGGPNSSAALILDLLRDLIPNSTVLKSLTLDWLNLELQDMRELIDLLPQSQSLRTLKLVRCLLINEHLELLLETMRPDQLENVEIRDCDVTDEALGSILKYIRNGNVLTFDVDTNEFTTESRQEVRQEISNRIEQFENENEKLRRTIECLRAVAKTQFNDNRTVAIGPGAEEFNRRLRDLAQSLPIPGKA
jgi:hypothetical protein